MRSVGIRALREALSEYVRIAASGEVVLVTHRDVVVAELTAPQASRASRPADALLADLVRQGVITPASLVGAGPPLQAPIVEGERGDVLAELSADREDR
jgi:antitoxin (DNA-binding transcriptional repressor) of toxin-antitoxin stability system